MGIKICGAPCSWGVDDPKNPYLPKWTQVLKEASMAGYKGIELGPYGYLPLDIDLVSKELNNNGLNVVAGTIFDNLVDESNLENLKTTAKNICELIVKLPKSEVFEGQHFPTPYLVIIDWGHDERDYAAGHPDKALGLSAEDWAKMMAHIKEICAIAKEYNVRPVIHPHAGGYIEFQDELEMIVRDIPYDMAGLCLDTGHMYYSKMDPVENLRKYKDKIDYVHFKDVNRVRYDEAMNKKIRFFEACGEGVMCPIGDGDIDYTAVNNVLKEINYNGYITIEQERDPRNTGSILDDVKKSYDYLVGIGYQV